MHKTGDSTQGPLSDEELGLLGDFLLYRIDDHAETMGRDEGIICVSKLDGYFTAIVSGPVMLPPSIWLPGIWGEFEPNWESEDALTAIFSLMMRHMNDISSTLMTSPEQFTPVFKVSNMDGEENEIVDEWCEGYLRGVHLTTDLWQFEDDDSANLLGLILAFTEQADFFGHKFEEADRTQMTDTIPAAAALIHRYWLEQRMPDQPIHPSRKVGRNDPCPCGSGKKYKKCCLH